LEYYNDHYIDHMHAAVSVITLSFTHLPHRQTPSSSDPYQYIRTGKYPALLAQQDAAAGAKFSGDWQVCACVCCQHACIAACMFFYAHALFVSDCKICSSECFDGMSVCRTCVCVCVAPVSPIVSHPFWQTDHSPGVVVQA
jgi:hypothetical protein